MSSSRSLITRRTPWLGFSYTNSQGEIVKIRHIVPTAILGLTLTLAGCGGSDGGKDTSKPTNTAAKTTAAGGDFCDGLKANGATGASFGPPQIFLPKADLIEETGRGLAVMGDLTPPDEIAAEWKVRKDYLAKLKAAADKLPDGGTLNDPALAPDDATNAASGKLTDYWFASCQA